MDNDLDYAPCADQNSNQQHFDQHVLEYRQEVALRDDTNHACPFDHAAIAHVQLNTLHRMHEVNPLLNVPADVALPAARTPLNDNERAEYAELQLSKQMMFMFASPSSTAGPQQGISIQQLLMALGAGLSDSDSDSDMEDAPEADSTRRSSSPSL